MVTRSLEKRGRGGSRWGCLMEVVGQICDVGAETRERCVLSELPKLICTFSTEFYNGRREGKVKQVT